MKMIFWLRLVNSQESPIALMTAWQFSQLASLMAGSESWVVDPNFKSAIDEPPQESEVRAKQGGNVLGFKNGNKQVCNGGCWRHPHCYALCLVDNYVAKAHPVVPHDKGHVNNDCFRVLMTEVAASLFLVEVLADAGNRVFCIDICVHGAGWHNLSRQGEWRSGICVVL
jgi:hypothetical protein